jgi:hypothetical protein
VARGQLAQWHQQTPYFRVFVRIGLPQVRGNGINYDGPYVAQLAQLRFESLEIFRDTEVPVSLRTISCISRDHTINEIRASQVCASRFQTWPQGVCWIVLRTQEKNISRRASLAVNRPAPAGSYYRRDAGRDLRLTESGIARQNREFTSGDPARPKPADWLCLDIRQAPCRE